MPIGQHDNADYNKRVLTMAGSRREKGRGWRGWRVGGVEKDWEVCFQLLVAEAALLRRIVLVYRDEMASVRFHEALNATTNRFVGRRGMASHVGRHTCIAKSNHAFLDEGSLFFRMFAP